MSPTERWSCEVCGAIHETELAAYECCPNEVRSMFECPECLELYLLKTEAEECCACNHSWRWVKDWFGDPSVPGGTCDCSHWQCTKCGSEDCDDPPPDQHDDEPEI